MPHMELLDVHRAHAQCVLLYCLLLEVDVLQQSQPTLQTQSCGVKLSCLQVLYALTAGVAGYVSAVQYKVMGGTNWVSFAQQCLRCMITIVP